MRLHDTFNNGELNRNKFIVVKKERLKQSEKKTLPLLRP